jgi:hypothetical protein
MLLNGSRHIFKARHQSFIASRGARVHILHDLLGRHLQHRQLLVLGFIGYTYKGRLLLARDM